MKIAQLFFKGNYEDAYAYKGWLNCVTCDHTLEMYNLEQVAAQIDPTERSGIASYYCFARNDLLKTEQFRTLMRDKSIRYSFFNLVDRLPPTAEVKLEEGQYLKKTQLKLQADVILDLLFYNSRLYLGAETGVFDVDVDWTAKEINGRLRKRHDAKCLNLSAGMGAVNASCGNDGLFSAIDDFGISRPGPLALTQTADRSIRSGWLRFLLANYSSNRSVNLFQTSRKPVSKYTTGEHASGEMKESQIITEIFHSQSHF
jgi:hypothetical protein